MKSIQFLYYFFQNPRKQLRLLTRNTFYLLFISVLVGIVVGLASVALKSVIEEFLIHFFHGKGEVILGSIPTIPFYLLLLIPASGGLLVGIIKYVLMKSGAKGGVEQVMYAIAVKDGNLSFKEVVEKFITSAITLGTGGSAGKEGPVVHIGGGIGSVFARLLQLPEEYVKALVAAGAASGIAAAFNAPIAGTFFALEILLGDLSLNIFSMIMVASIAATSVSRFFLGLHPAFSPPVYQVHSPVEFIFYVFLGILAGFLTVVFIRSLVYSRDIFVRLKMPAYLKPALGGLLVGSLALVIPNILGIGYGTIDSLLKFEEHLQSIYVFGFSPQEYPLLFPWLMSLGLLGIIFGKVIATSLTLGSGGSGGTIVPSLFLGASLGALVGHLVNTLFPAAGISVGTYSLIGMGSVIAGITQAPIMAILLFFETTRSYHIILPVAIVSILASQITKFFLNGSLYTLELRHLGIDLYEGMEKTVMSTIRVGDIMRTNLLTVPFNMPLRQIMELFLHTRFTTAIVIDKDGSILGRLHMDDLKRLVETPSLYNVLIASEIMETDVDVLAVNDSLSKTVELLSRRHSSLIPVVERRGEKVPVGFITRKDILNVYEKEILRKNISGIKFKSPVANLSSDGIHSRQAIDFSSDYTLRTVQVPKAWRKKSLAKLKLRQKHGLTVLAILDQDEDVHRIPTPEYEFKESDLIVIAGTRDSMKEVEKLLPRK